MAYFIVNYQLNKDGQDYQNLWDEFERLEAQKAQRTVYLVDCNANDASSLLQGPRPRVFRCGTSKSFRHRPAIS